jgi:predicted MFS family arabinose efflux permease
MRSLLWLALGAFAVGTEGFMIAGLLPRIAGDLDVSVAQAGYLVTVFGATYAIGSPIIAVLTGTVERKRLLLLALGAFALANLLAAWSEGFLGLLASRALLALTAGAFMPAATAYAATSVEPHHRGRAISMVYTGFTMALVIGVPLGTAIGTRLGWRSTFELVAVLAVLAGVGILIALRRQAAAGVVGIRARLGAARASGVPSILALTVLTLGGAFAVFTYFAPLVSTELGVGPDAVAGYLMLFGVAAFIGNLVGGNVADKIPAGRALAAILTVLAITSAAVAVAGGLPHAAAAIILPIAIAVWGLFGWGFMPIQQSRLVALNPAMATVLLSLNASAIYVGVALGSALGGVVVAHGPIRNLGWVSVACDLVALTVLTLSARRPEAADPETDSELAVEPSANAAE